MLKIAITKAYLALEYLAFWKKKPLYDTLKFLKILPFIICNWAPIDKVSWNLKGKF